MADDIKGLRINRFHGGITTRERDNTVGATLVCEELDVYSDPTFIEPETVMSADNGVITDGIYDYAYDHEDDILYALGKTAGNDIKTWSLASASTDNPGAFASHFNSGNDADVDDLGAMLLHRQTESSVLKRYLYYTGAVLSTGIPLYRLGDIATGGTTESNTDTASTTMLLTGIKTDLYPNIPRPRITLFGESYFGHGQYIAAIDDTGVFSEKAFTLPDGWYCIDFIGVKDSMWILAYNGNDARIYVWNLVDTSGFDDTVLFSSTYPLAIENHNDAIRVFSHENNQLVVHDMLNKYSFVSNSLTEVQNPVTDGSGYGDGSVYVPMSKKSMFIDDNVLYFGLWKTDKSGIYALAYADDEKNNPLALTLAKRFIPSTTSPYTGHRPIAMASVGPNIFASYFDAAAGIADYQCSRVEENNSPNLSSDAILETVWIDGGAPETTKEWHGFALVTKPMPASCSITVDCRTDNASSYDSGSQYALSNSNDQTKEGETADVFWRRDWPSVIGRAIQVRFRFTSNGTNGATLISTLLLKRDLDLL